MQVLANSFILPACVLVLIVFRRVAAGTGSHPVENPARIDGIHGSYLRAGKMPFLKEGA